MTDNLVSTPSDALVQELRILINATRGRVAQTINNELVALYWQLGRRLRDEVVRDERATYGEQIVTKVGRKLSVEIGRGFSRSNLYYMMKFAEVFRRPRLSTRCVDN